MRTNGHCRRVSTVVLHKRRTDHPELPIEPLGIGGCFLGLVLLAVSWAAVGWAGWFVYIRLAQVLAQVLR